GDSWALANQTTMYMNGWFHYAKLYAALLGCLGFMMIKYEWGIGAKRWFKPFSFVIVAVNILIAVVSDLESAVKGWNCWWLTSEGVWQYGGWHNVMNAAAGLLNIFCMTAWWSVYPSKDRSDMLWPDMTWVYILTYDIWNFTYTYNCLPTHSWYCGVALLLAPTIAAMFWNRGGWIQNRAFTLAVWCMFAQVFPLFLVTFPDGSQYFDWVTLPATYADGTLNGIVEGGHDNVNQLPMLLLGSASLLLNAIALGYIIIQSRNRHLNPYKDEVFVNQKYYKDAVARM
ncbi:MAG: DUF5692 family protein, partial [Acidaminococcaceae bacterium]|nr:DUF5692 family protein [Acidaminococcaceae bacterium]